MKEHKLKGRKQSQEHIRKRQESRFINTGNLGFKKGNIPWNKGKKHIPCPEERKEYLRQLYKGRIPWNKGLTKKDHPGLLKISEATKKNGNPNKGKKFTQLSGEKHWNWKGGKTKLTYKIRHSLEYKNWRNLVFKRDNYTCRHCGKKNCYLEVHHIKEFYVLMDEFKIDSFEKAIKCPKLWEMENAITLCKKCHKKTDSYGWGSVNKIMKKRKEGISV